ncbi:Cj0814 family flagellar-dependent secreted protein, partial [Campylobacter aviculae]
MLNFNTGFGNNLFTNLNINVKKNQSSLNSSNSNVKNLQELKESSNTNNKVLGYEVDKDGYFTSEFNKAAGIPEDIKIHSSTMESLVRVETGCNAFIRTFESIDIAKTIGNAYKILSQVVGEDVLNSKDSFTLDEIAKFPQGYEYNRQSMEVTKIYNSIQDFLNGEMNFDYDNKTDTFIESLFFNSYVVEDAAKAKPATDIFNNNNGGKEN